MKINLIALESGADSTTVSLLQFTADSKPRLSTERQEGLRHAENMLPMIDGLLSANGLTKADITGVAFGQGPGAFTGLRSACSVAQGLSLGMDIPIVAVDTLAAVAHMAGQVQDNKLIVSLLDARMGECYMGVYRFVTSDEPLQVLQPPCLIPALNVKEWLSANFSGSQFLLCGNALNEFPELNEADGVFSQGSAAWPDAGVIASMALTKHLQGQHIDSSQAAPIYIRDKVAFTESERQAGAGGNPSAQLPVHKAPEQATRADSMIRAMTEQDLDAVTAIEVAVSDTPWSLGNLRDSLNSGYHSVVIEDPESQSSSVVGYAVQMLAPDTAQLLIIGVHPDFQRRGFGTRLLNNLEQNASAQRLPTQLLEVKDSNEQAQGFYTKHGYQRIGRRKGYYRGVNGGSEDAIIMQKDFRQQ